MGLRSLYTILSKAASDLKYLEPAVGIVLGFIGGKMIAEYFGAEIPTEYALGVVAFFLSMAHFDSGPRMLSGLYLAVLINFLELKVRSEKVILGFWRFCPC